MECQSRLLFIFKYLYACTDLEHDVSSKDIMRMLESNDISPPDRRTIDSDIDALSSAGMVFKRHPARSPSPLQGCRMRFDTVELKILIDAVAASQFINAERSKHVIQCLVSLVSSYAKQRVRYLSRTL